ncbi:uncharacterized protein LOC115791178 [Archocentrus centrarchus]|uniref:uncharacterized protein LOC115791178 n=1 Tax=Archocentrus centrarchus TaxID=63155 RepID=UPI0011E9EDC4|nr:uncharacterized protein LOC115791178 [Archocentrus centrarchus]
MRPTTSTMLQQNNNNNYPCLNMSGSSREMLQKCSRASLPFPSRLELADLPLIRGLRAWALCSKNRHKTASLLGGGQAPAAPPVGRGGSTPCPRPADVYLSEEWGRMGYGLPLGVDGRQAGIGALVTVATLKTSEGSGKTQTQCLFLRTEKGSCLYSAAKPSSGVTASAASSVVGGWLRGKTGGGCRDTLAGPTPPPQTGANQVRVRSGRRWRKSGNVAGREKTGVSRERQQRSREVPTGESTVEERQEEQDKGGPDCKEFPSPQQDNRRARCCHSVSPKSCVQCGRRAQRRKSQDEHEGGIPNKLIGEVTGMSKERQKNEDEEKGDLCKPEPSNCVLTELNSDPESTRTYSDSHGSCEDREMREAESSEGQKTQTSHSKDAEKNEDTCTERNNDFTERKPSEEPCEEEEEDETNVKGFSDHVEADEESEKRSESAGVTDEKENLIQAPAEFSDWAAVFTPASGRAAVSLRFNQSATPIEGSVCTADKQEQENSQNHLDPGVTGEEEVANEKNTVNEKVNKKPQFVFKNEENCSQQEEEEASPSPLRDGDASIAESGERIVTENSSDCGTIESEARDELQSEDENFEERLDPEHGGEAREIWRWECTFTKLDDCKGDVMLKDDDEGVKRNCAPQEDWRSQEFKGGHGRREKEEGCTCAPTSITSVEPNEESNITNAACTDPPTSPALSKANPAPPLPTLGSMATGLPCQEEEEEEALSSTAGDREGGQEGKRNCRRELEEQSEVESGSAVATDEGRKEEEEEDEFGVFMQAEGEPAWSEEFTMSASVPCESRESAALGKHAVTGESTLWTPGTMDSSFHRSDDTWTAFPRDSSDGGGDVVEQWWPASAVEERRDGLSANQNLAAVFAEAFPSLTGSSSSDPCDLKTVPTLSQLLRGGASRDQGLLDSFHDLNKMIGQRYKRANGVSRYLLLKTLHLEQPPAESRPAPWTVNCRLSPGLPSANRHAQHAAAKRRLSYDYNRNVME